VFAKDTENDQRGGEQKTKGKEFAALVLKKLRKSRGFIGGLGVKRIGCTMAHW